ncbi:MAG: 1,4-alpha-glucan branching protein GlgB [Firmicutes bacterium]|nr:1,4-alpha-glucan branching protein GlgB [Bacillota bacterium]
MKQKNDFAERFYNGEGYSAHEYFGCHFNREEASAEFCVWAPRAKSVSVVGDFNGWDIKANPMEPYGDIWLADVSPVKEFDGYKYYIVTKDGRGLYKADPYAFHAEAFGGGNSKVYAMPDFAWTDEAWQSDKRVPFERPMNVYEAHIGSWRKYPDGNFFSYRKFADEIAPYLKKMKYTHLELIGVAEHPFDGSWGYQVTGYFAPTSRYGTPADFCYLVNKLHHAGIGVILDWVPGHFPKDESGLYEFDGAPLYEPEDPLRREHKEWGTRCFDYECPEVKSFLISNALFWLDVYHADGLRVDAVASMLYHDYGRKEFRLNRYGGKENIGGIDFFQELNTAVFAKFPNALMIAEESTAWPLVTRPVNVGGLGFNFKWNMGWMNDTLSYAKTDPYFRSYAHDKLTFAMTYAYSENYILPVSHDEVVHGKGSLINKMPGDYALKFAGWRNYLMYMFSHPGKKLTMMGTEFASFSEWDYKKELDWMLLEFPAHADAQKFTAALNAAYQKYPAFWQIEDGWDGFAWRVVDDNTQNVLVYERADKAGGRMLCVFNFAGVEWPAYRFGAAKGAYTTVLYSDAHRWGLGKTVYKTEGVESHGQENSLVLDIKPMSGIFLRRNSL